MLKGCITILFLASLSLAFFPIGAASQEIQYLDEHATKEDFINALKPQRPSTTQGFTPGTRGLRRSATLVTQPSCNQIRARGTRAVKMITPISNVAAIEIHFDFNSDKLRQDDTQTLDTLAEALKSNELASCCMRIEGHTDDVGGDQYNKQLSERRAQNVVRYLVDKHGLNPEQLLAVGYGKSQPAVKDASEEGRQKNRRARVATLQ